MDALRESAPTPKRNGQNQYGDMRSSINQPLKKFAQASANQDEIDTKSFKPDQTSRGRVAIFIDAANLFYAAQQLDITIDYTKLLSQLVDGSRLLRAFFYTGVDSTSQKQQAFLLWLRRNGYRVIAKELSLLPDGTKKTNIDVEIAVDMLDLAPYYDTAILVSGNGTLTYAVDNVSYLGVRIEVVSLRSMTSDSLLTVADAHIDLAQIKEQIQKR